MNINGSRIRIMKNLSASQVAVMLAQCHPLLTVQQVFALGGELWEASCFDSGDGGSG